MTEAPFTIAADFDLGAGLDQFAGGASPDVTVSRGVVPETLGAPKGEMFEILDRRFLLHVPRGPSFLVEDGTSVTYAANGAAAAEIAVYLLGSGLAAIAYQRGLLPFHASAVAVGGQVHAFTGTSGAGKSTLVAALAHGELDFFSDDVLLLDVASLSSGRARCFAGPKTLKLWSDALDLVEVQSLGLVRPESGLDKVFAAPGAKAARRAGELASMTVLQATAGGEDQSPTLARLRGADALRALHQAVYRKKYAEAIWGRERIFQTLARLAPLVSVRSFARSRERPAFPASTLAIRRALLEYGSPSN